MKTTVIPRTWAIALLGLLALLAVLSLACGGSDGTAEAQQAPASAEKPAAKPANAEPLVDTKAPAAAAQTTAATSAPATAPPVAAAPAAPAPADTPPPAPPAAPAPVDTPPPAPNPVDVNVSLSEFKIDSSLTTFQAGVPYHFIVVNNGKIGHEINIGQSAHAALAVGATVTLDVTFGQQGPLEFTCHLPAHYEAGMKLPVTIGP